MGQIVMIDEDVLEDLKFNSYWGKYFFYHLGRLQEELYPEYMSVDSISHGQVCKIILDYMEQEIKDYRNPPWKKTYKK